MESLPTRGGEEGGGGGGGVSREPLIDVKVELVFPISEFPMECGF